MMSRSFQFLREPLDALESASRLRKLVPRTPTGTTFTQAGQTLINFGSNDYLGLASRVAPEISTSGGAASSLVSGWTEDHQELADQIARLESTESAVVFPSGYAACSGVVATLPGKHDLILSDALNHASLIDGCRLSPADCIVYPHRDVVGLRSILAEKRHRYSNVWIVTDGIFSMDGHTAPLVAIADVADEFDAILIADEAHGTGVLGRSGGGVCQAMGVKSRVPIRVGTLSKAIGGQGGFVAGPGVVIDYLVNRCRSLIYSTSLAPTAVATALRGLRAIQDEPELRERVTASARRMRKALSIHTGEPESGVPIIPIIIGADELAVAVSTRLARAGFFVPAIRPPTVPEGTARLRISISAAHSQEHLDRLVNELRTAGIGKLFFA